MLHGCFTGVESTPRITQTSEQRKAIAATAEERLMAEVEPESLDQWRQGKKFTVTDSKIYMVLSPASAAQSLVAGSELNYQTYHKSVSALGDTLLTLTFTSDGINEPMTYSLPAGDYPQIPFTVEQSLVNHANLLLNGRTLYVLTAERMNGVVGNKFSAVRVTDVTTGDEDMPLVVRFREIASGDSSAIRLSLSGSRTFSNSFSITDPHKAYPNISDEMWQQIRSGQVCEGMTREECRLALGSTTDVNRFTNHGVIEERWTYPNGIYLIFRDNILTHFRR